MENTGGGKAFRYNVYFGNDDIGITSIKYPAIIFTPTRDTWNDFKYKCRYMFRLFENSDQCKGEGLVFLGFAGIDKRIKEDGQIEINEEVLPAAKLPTFFTLQGGMKEYREFIKEYGVEKSNDLLLQFNDLVAVKRSSKKPKWLADAVKTEVFRLAFMRDSERFFAFHNADSLFDGLESEDLGGISRKVSLKYKLDGFQEINQFDMNFDLESILSKRMNVLIGCNGLGKSQALSSIVRSLLDGDDNFYDREHGRLRISRVLAIETPGETTTTFPQERPSKRIKYRRLVLNRFSRSKSSRGFGELFVMLVRSEEYIKGKSRWDIFSDSLSFLPDYENFVIPIDPERMVSHPHLIEVNEKKYIPLKNLKHGGEQETLELWGAVARNANPLKFVDNKVIPLSSGQLAFVKFAVQACLFVENGTLVLLDEPETHLHPNYISEFIRLLDRLLEITGSIAVLATHSAYFVRELPRSQVLVFKKDNDSVVHIQNPRLKTYGADIGSISYFVFEDEITNILVEELIDKLPESNKEKITVLAELESELSSDVLMYLRRKLDLGV